MNRHIIVAVVVISGAGIVNAWTGKKHITPVIIGSYVFLLVLSIMDTFGGAMSQLSGALAMIAMVYVLLTEVNWQQIIAFAQGKVSGPSGAPGTTQPIVPGSGASH